MGWWDGCCWMVWQLTSLWRLKSCALALAFLNCTVGFWLIWEYNTAMGFIANRIFAFEQQPRSGTAVRNGAVTTSIRRPNAQVSGPERSKTTRIVCDLFFGTYMPLPLHIPDWQRIFDARWQNDKYQGLNDKYQAKRQVSGQNDKYQAACASCSLWSLLRNWFSLLLESPMVRTFFLLWFHFCFLKLKSIKVGHTLKDCFFEIDSLKKYAHSFLQTPSDLQDFKILKLSASDSLMVTACLI